MNSIDLLTSNGNRNIDRIMQGVIGIFETAFPGRIRSYYLDGSYTDGTAIPHASDIDGYIIFRHDFLDDVEREKAQHLVTQCGYLSQPEFDMLPKAEAHLDAH
jgi:tRNA nucleotidyltransferase (CCA-adding enzyme)